MFQTLYLRNVSNILEDQKCLKRTMQMFETYIANVWNIYVSNSFEDQKCLKRTMQMFKHKRFKRFE